MTHKYTLKKDTHTPVCCCVGGGPVEPRSYRTAELACCRVAERWSSGSPRHLSYTPREKVTQDLKKKHQNAASNDGFKPVTESKAHQRHLLTAESVRMVAIGDLMFFRSHTFTVRSSLPDTTLSPTVNTADVTVLQHTHMNTPTWHYGKSSKTLRRL